MDPRTEAPDTSRDALEMRLVNEALAADLPVLGICRGLQLLNVAHGGTLIQHLPNTEDHRVRPPDASSDIHTVSVAEETRLAAIEGAGERPVNSRHHQAIDRVGEGLRVSAVATGDGVIEAVERPDRKFAVAVQWHAEDRFRRDSRDQRLFEAFAAAMQK
jgi:gamma-glutamyl-gamma-aminobutyrate hydrolase PuuD